MDLSAPIRYLSLFSGAGGLDLAVRIALPKAVCVCHVEIEVPAVEFLAARHSEGSLDDAPVYSDVRSFDGSLWRGAVDLIVGGFPCTDLSQAGRRTGIDGDSSGLWWEFLRIIRECEPEYVLIENVPGLLGRPNRNADSEMESGDETDGEPADWTFRNIDAVLGPLAEVGFDAEWLSLRASDVGASHKRERVFILAYRNRKGCGELGEPDGRQDTWIGLPESTTLTDSIRLWSTPHGSGNLDASGKMGGAGGGEFAKEVSQWSSPRANADGSTRTESGNPAKDGIPLSQQAAAWQTPGTDSFRSRGGERVNEMGLDQQARNWPTPNQTDTKGEQVEACSLPAPDWVAMASSMRSSEFCELILEKLGHAIRRSSETPSNGDASSKSIPTSRRRLNPAFDLWLMGWPLSFGSRVPTSYGRLETELFLLKVRWLLESLCGGVLPGADAPIQSLERGSAFATGVACGERYPVSR